MRVCATSVRKGTWHLKTVECGNTNDMIAAAAFGAEWHVPRDDFNALKGHDLVFFSMYKVQQPEESRWMEVAHRLKDETSTAVILFQECETWWMMTRSWAEQKSFIELLGKVDLFLTHQQRDVQLWGNFRKDKPTMRWTTCLDLNKIQRWFIDCEKKNPRKILAGASFDSRANGLTALVACDGLAPLMKQERTFGENYERRSIEGPQVFGIEYERIPHLGWYDWLGAISQAYIAVHPMPCPAAGRDQIAFAALGIPCVGNDELDLQRELFRGLECNCWDVDRMRNLAEGLLRDEEEFCRFRTNAMRLVKQYCSLTAAGDQARVGLSLIR